MPQKPNVVAGLPGPLVPLEEGDLGGYLRLDTWTLTEALFILNGNHPPGIESSSELMSHFWNAYHLAVNSIQSGNLCREIKVAGERRFIESPTRWLSWAERKNLYVADAVRAEMMLAESVDEKTDAPGGVEDRNDERPEYTPPSDRAVESDEAPELPDTITDGVNSKVEGKAKAKRAYSKAKARRWYTKRKKEWPPDQRPPSRKEDIRAAKNECDEAVTYRFISKLRNELAPEWTAKGRPPS